MSKRKLITLNLALTHLFTSALIITQTIKNRVFKTLSKLNRLYNQTKLKLFLYQLFIIFLNNPMSILEFLSLKPSRTFFSDSGDQ